MPWAFLPPVSTYIDMVKFIEDKVNDDLMYSKTNYLWSFNLPIIMRVGVRGTGKTFDAKRQCLKRWLYKRKKFIWVRSSETACDKMKRESGDKFFCDLGEKFKDRSVWKISGDAFYSGKDIIGSLIPLSTFYKEKGNAYNDVDIIVFDEVIPERVERKYFDRVKALIDTCETIARTRPNIKLVLLSNALDKGDEILAHFGFKLTKFGYYINKDMGVILHYERPTLTYQKAHAKSLAGRLASGTEYEANALNNEFSDRTEFFEKKPKDCKLLYILHDENDFACRLYASPSTDYLYCARDFNRMACQNMRYTNTVSDIAPNRTYFNNRMAQSLAKLYTANRVLFQDSKVKNVFISFLPTSI